MQQPTSLIRWQAPPPATGHALPPSPSSMHTVAQTPGATQVDPLSQSVGWLQAAPAGLVPLHAVESVPASTKAARRRNELRSMVVLCGRVEQVTCHPRLV